jgi:lycopene cyclase domain-containing protein
MSSTIYSFTYLASLLIGLAALTGWDYHKRIAFFKNPRASILVIAISVGFFLVWDILGILLNIFHTNTHYVSGLFILTPDLPLEEILFLSFLTYFVLILDRLRMKK